MNRVAPQQAVDKDLHSIQRGNSIQSRIRRAESANAKPELSEQRRKEFEDRIESLLKEPEAKPEIEVIDEEAASGIN